LTGKENLAAVVLSDEQPSETSRIFPARDAPSIPSGNCIFFISCFCTAEVDILVMWASICFRLGSSERYLSNIENFLLEVVVFLQLFHGIFSASVKRDGELALFSLTQRRSA
jgi:hypothetical protein